MRDYWISRAIRICGSQKELARRIGAKPDKISYLLNEAKKISLEDALLIEEATGGIVSRYHLANRMNVKLKRKLEELDKTLHELRISERTTLGIAYEKSLGKRKGIRNDLQPRENFPQVKGRTEEIAAHYSGFGNYKTYHQAKQIVQYGIPELIQAMDNHVISISTASQFIGLPENEQYRLLQLNKKEISEQIRQIKQMNHKTIARAGQPDLSSLWWISVQWCFQLMQRMEHEQHGKNTNG